MGSILSLFKYEYNFYSQNLAQQIGLRVPRCYFSAFGNYGRVCILLEDFSPARSPDQLESLSKSDVEEALTQISKLHAKYRGRVNDVPELRWCLKQDDNSYFKVAMSEVSKKSDYFEKVLKHGLEIEPKEYEHMIDVVRWLQNNQETYLRLMTNLFQRRNGNLFPSTLIHGDLRSENILFPQTHMKEFMVFDFQCIKENNGMMDIAYHIGSSMSVKDRRLHERDLLIHYYNVMRQRGATDLTFAEILLMYQWCHVWLVIVSVFGVATDSTKSKDKSKHDEKSKKVGVAFINRSNGVCKDWNVLAALNFWSKKIQDDNTIDLLTREEQINILPNGYLDLLERDDEVKLLAREKKKISSEEEEGLVGVTSRHHKRTKNQCIIS